MRSSVTETVLALSLAFRTGNITTRATHAATELGALLLQFPPWPAISQATAEQEQLPASVVGAHARADHQRGHSRDGRPVFGRGRRPGRRVRDAN